MKITQIKELDPMSMNRCIFIGAPGIGKTEEIKRYAEAIAKKMGRRFVDLRSDKEIDNIDQSFYYLRIIAPHVFPEDISIPRMADRGMEFITPHIIDVLTRPEAKGLMFIDELNNVQKPDQRVLFYALIQEGEIGWGARISKDVIIVSAGNPPEWSSDAVSLPHPLINRTVVINVQSPTLDEWMDYMDIYHSQWDRRVATFLKAFPKYFLKQPEEEDLKNYPTPRSWTNLAVRLFKENDMEIIRDIVMGAVGPEVSAFFMSFLGTKVPSIKEFVDNPGMWDDLDISQQVLLLYHISQNFNTFKNMDGSSKVLREWLRKKKDNLILLVKLIPRANRREVLGPDFMHEFAKELVDYVG
jgi:hypothetical protein